MKEIRNKTERAQILERALLIVALDIIVVLIASYVAIWLRYDFSFQQIERIYLVNIYKYAPINIVCTVGVFYIFHLYTSLWKYASVSELCNVIFAVITSSLLLAVGMHLSDLAMPQSYWLIYFMFLLVMTAAIRFFYRFMRFFRNMLNPKKMDNVMIIGAGDAGAAIIKEIHLSKKFARNVCCIIDDNPLKQGRYIQGCPVVGGRGKIKESVEKYSIGKIISAMPAASKHDIRIEIYIKIY